jgi:hypothetical protein
MLKKIAVVFFVLIVAILALAAGKPDTFHVERSVSINASPEKIVPLIDDFHNWTAWSPWETRDPLMKRTYSGPVRGKGAAYAWEGNKDVGKGRMEIAASSPASKVTINLDFVKPFEAHNVADFILEPQGGTTKVTWAMHGPSPFLSKVIHVFLSMDRMVGKDFEAGLANLKAAAEK